MLTQDTEGEAGEILDQVEAVMDRPDLSDAEKLDLILELVRVEE